MRKWLVIFCLVSACSLRLAATDPASPLRLEVAEHTDVRHEFTRLAKSYGLTITNLTDGVVTIQRGIEIEGKTPEGRRTWDGSIQAVTTCTHYEQMDDWKAPIRIAAHDTLAFVTWNGFLCGGQCTDACLQNVKAGPGIYRFVVVVVPGGKRIASPSFIIPRK